jgi:hypothetical protein
LRDTKAQWAERAMLRERMENFRPEDVRSLLDINGLELQIAGAIDLVSGKDQYQLTRDQLRRTLNSVVSRITLDPATRQVSANYRLPVVTPAAGVDLASPQRSESNSGTVIRLCTVGSLPHHAGVGRVRKAA